MMEYAKFWLAGVAVLVGLYVAVVAAIFVVSLTCGAAGWLWGRWRDRKWAVSTPDTDKGA